MSNRDNVRVEDDDGMKHTPGPVAPERLVEIADVAVAVPPESEMEDSPMRGSEASAFEKAALPSVESPLSPAKVIERLSRASKRGRLAGFRVIEPGKIAAVTAFGGVYDYDLLLRLRPRGTTGSSIDFEMRLLRKVPIIAVLLIVVSVFPGLQLTHSMLSIYFSWYTIDTWWWYLPLVALSLPFMWNQFKASRTEAHRDARVTIGKIETLLEKQGIGDRE
jgi:hypothetical protein